MTDDNKKFKKQWVNNKGEIQNIEYTLPKKTINDELSEDIEKTKKMWEKQSIFTVTDNFQEQLKPKMGKYFKYIRRMKDGSLKARMGGSLMLLNEEKKYLMLLNARNMTAWSVQFKDIVIMYETPKQKDDDEDEPESKRIEKQQKEIQKQLRKEEREKKKKEKEEKLKEKELKKEAKEEKKAEGKNGVNGVSPSEKLTDEEANAVLNKEFYENDMRWGRDKLYKTLRSQGHYLTRKQVDDWLKKQKLYQLDKPVFQPKDFVTQNGKEVNSVWNIDLVEMDGDKIVLNCVDRFSKYAYSRIIPRKTANAVIKALKSIFQKDKPKSIVSDNGGEFKSVTTQEFLKDNKVRQLFSSANTPQSNGLVENLNKQFKSILKKMSYQKTDQKTTLTQPVLTRILKAYNNSYHSAIDMTPTEAKKPENKEAVLKANEKKVSVGMKTLQKDDIEKGDQVRVSLSKGNDKKTKEYRTNWSEELFYVKKVMRGKGLNPTQYKIEDAQSNPIKGNFKREEIQSVKYVENENEVDVPYEIERFIKEQGDEIQVSYKGYRKEDRRWIEKSILKNDLGRTVYKKLYDEMK